MRIWISYPSWYSLSGSGFADEIANFDAIIACYLINYATQGRDAMGCSPHGAPLGTSRPTLPPPDSLRAMAAGLRVGDGGGEELRVEGAGLLSLRNKGGGGRIALPSKCL